MVRIAIPTLNHCPTPEHPGYEVIPDPMNAGHPHDRPAAKPTGTIDENLP